MDDAANTAVPYRPSNGHEGRQFDNRFCDRCKRDDAYRTALVHSSMPSADGCEILAATMAFDESDPSYPKEWIEDANGPRCTAFDPIEDEGL